MSTLVTQTIQSSTSAAVVFKNSSGTEKGQLCRAWIKAAGDGSSTNADFGFSGLTDHGEGQISFHFDTNMSNTNYCIVGAHGQGSRTNPSKFWFVKENDVAVDKFRLEVNTATGGLADLGDYFVAVFGD